MWRAYSTKYLLGIRYNVDLIALLRTNSTVRQLCGFSSSIPSESIFSRFFKRLTNHQDLVDRAIQDVVNRLAAAVNMQKDLDKPRVGRILAIDSTDIPAWVNTTKKSLSDLDAEWGHRTNSKAQGGEEIFYGYKMHLVCDAHWGIPLGHIILPANASDSPQLPKIFDKIRAKHRQLPLRYALADKGYDALTNYQYLDQHGILAAIPIRNTDKEGDYTLDGRPSCVGNRPMEYVATYRKKGHLFRCTPAGCALRAKWDGANYCRDVHFEQVTGDQLRKVGRLARANPRWRRLYRKRQTIERLFRSLKHSRLLNQHRYRGMAKIALHASLSILTCLGTMLLRVQAGDLDKIRQMRLKMPETKRVPPPYQLRLAV